GEVLLPPRQPGLPRLRDGLRQGGRLHLLRPPLPGGRARAGPQRGRDRLQPLGHGGRALRVPLEAGAAGARGGQRLLRGRHQPRGARGSLEDRRGLRPELLLRSPRPVRGRGPARQGRGGGGRPEPRPDRGGALHLAVLPRPPARRLRGPGAAVSTRAARTEGAGTYRNFIGGAWVDADSSRTVPNLNPADTREVLGWIPLSSAEDAKRAVAAAKAAFPAWRDTPSPVRGRILFEAWRIMEAEQEQLARGLTREEGKTVKEALGEIKRTINVLEYMAGEGRRMPGETLPSELPRNFCYTVRQPLGVIACITPWNFPLCIP